MPIALDIPATEAAIIAETNTFRRQHDLNALKQNKQLAAAARAYAKTLAKRSELTHTANGTTPPSRARAAGYALCEIAENLASIYDSSGFSASGYARRAVDGWKNSPGHRKNMLLANVTETGVGVAKTADNDPRYYAVQLLGRPEALKLSFRVVNRSSATVAYTFGGRNQSVSPRQVITHTSCAGGNLAFELGSNVARYEASDGRVYTLKAAAGGGVQLEVGKSAPSP